MEAAALFDHLITGSEMEMVGVGKLYLTADRLKIFRAQRALDGGLRANIHKDRGLDCAVGAGKFATTSLPFCFQKLKHYISSFCDF